MKIRMFRVLAALAVALPGVAQADPVSVEDRNKDGRPDTVVVQTAAGRLVISSNVGANFAGTVQNLMDEAGKVVITATGIVGGLQNPALPRSPGETAGDRSTVGNCAFRVDTTEGNNVLLTVRGTGTTGGRPRAVATEIQCRILNDAGAIVFDLTRAEVGSVAPLAGAVIIRNDGPYTVCARADAKFDDGEDVSWPNPNDFVTMACATP